MIIFGICMCVCDSVCVHKQKQSRSTEFITLGYVCAYLCIKILKN